ncbi:a2.1 [Tranosema rostrale ichnovirus]|nr:a2.1 [Tranosema rostrale ichnovirus]
MQAILEGYSDTVIDMMVLRQSPRVQIPPLTASEVQDIISSKRLADSSSHQPSSSPAPSYTELTVTEPIPPKECNPSLAAAMSKAPAPSEPRQSSNQQESSCTETMVEAAVSLPEPHHHSPICQDSFSEAPNVEATKPSEVGRNSDQEQGSSVCPPRMMRRVTRSYKLPVSRGNGRLHRQLSDMRKDVVALATRLTSCMEVATQVF